QIERANRARIILGFPAPSQQIPNVVFAQSLDFLREPASNLDSFRFRHVRHFEPRVILLPVRAVAYRTLDNPLCLGPVGIENRHESPQKSRCSPAKAFGIE